MEKLQHILDSIEPGELLAMLGPVLKKNLIHLGEEARVGFVLSLLGESGVDKVAGMVNL